MVTSGYSLGSLPKSYYDGLYDDTLLPSLKHYYGTNTFFKKVFFNVFRGQLFQTENVNIQLQDYVIFRNSKLATKRFLFAGIMCKYNSFFAFYNRQETKLASKILV